MVATIPYSIRIPREVLEEMKRHYDRMEPPKPTLSAILTHIVKLGWESYRDRSETETRLPEAVLQSYPKKFHNQTFSK